MILGFEVDPVQVKAGIGAVTIIETCELGSRAEWCSMRDAIIRSANLYVIRNADPCGKWDPPFRLPKDDRFCPLVEYY